MKSFWKVRFSKFLCIFSLTIYQFLKSLALIYTLLDPEDITVYQDSINEIFDEKGFISASLHQEKNVQFFKDFFLSRCWIRFLEMK